MLSKALLKLFLIKKSANIETPKCANKKVYYNVIFNGNTTEVSLVL